MKPDPHTSARMREHRLLDRRDELEEVRARLEGSGKPSDRTTHRDEGDWVLIGVMQLNTTGHLAVPVLEPRRRMWMQHYKTKEHAVAASCDHACTRVGGGWVLNVVTGETHQVPASHSVTPP